MYLFTTYVPLLVMLISVRQAVCSFTEQDSAQISQFIKHVSTCRDIPGVSLSVVSNNRPVLERGFGLADVEGNVKATSNTLFCVASLTKAFTATLMGKLLDRNG